MSDTTPRDQLAQIIEDISSDEWRGDWISVADAILAAGWRPPARVVTTWEEVQSLREGTLVLIERWGRMWVYECQEDDAWSLQGRGWLDESWRPPATVIYDPEEGE